MSRSRDIFFSKLFLLLLIAFYKLSVINAYLNPFEEERVNLLANGRVLALCDVAMLEKVLHNLQQEEMLFHTAARGE